MTKQHPLELEPEQLTKRCEVESFTFSNTSELEIEQTIYGQPRGVRAIEFGLNIDMQGYNIYVLGPTGSGRVTAIRQFIHDHAAKSPTPDDWCYVHNFKVAHRPKIMRLPAGQGRKLKADMRQLVEQLREEIPQAMAGDAFNDARRQVMAQFESERSKVIQAVQKQAQEMSFALQTTEQGMIIIVPLADGEPLTQEAIDKLSEEERETLNKNRQALQAAVATAFTQSQRLQNEAQDRLMNLAQEIGQQIIDTRLGLLQEKYISNTSVQQFFSEVREDMLRALDRFSAPVGGGNISDSPSAPVPPLEDPIRRYDVNVIVENEAGSGAPVIFLDLPTYRNLVGRIEHEVRFGALMTDFTLIKSGALHSANGGYLIIRAMDILQQPYVWDALKRALNTQRVIIEDSQTAGMSVMSTQMLEPEPIPIDLTVVLVGSQPLYYSIYDMDNDFRDLFRVKADFGEMMPRNPESEMAYAKFIANRCAAENLPPFNAKAVGRIVEYGSWLISDQRKLSTQFGMIATLIYEAAFFARKNNHLVVHDTDVDQAIQERTYRNNELEELVQEQIADGDIFIDLDGEVVGQINGLGVISVGDHTFGMPERVTARVYLGRDGIVQIDRETSMTGPIHDKGVLTLQGYLGGHYAHDYPLSLCASISFEQNYGGVEGDSASSTELYALLSALSGYALRQDIAVTGSVNQRGQVQPIGGATQKVEGFFTSCKTQGLTGSQGVIIPKTNIRDLMLNAEIIAAVKKGKFHIYAVETIDDGISLLTGKSPEEVHEAVDNRLRELAMKMEEFGNGDSKEGSEEE